MSKKTAAQRSIATRAGAQATRRHFPPLEMESRPTVCTAAAAHYLHLAQQTLRVYACRDKGPISPRRINGKLHWATADIRKLLGVAA